MVTCLNCCITDWEGKPYGQAAGQLCGSSVFLSLVCELSWSAHVVLGTMLHGTWMHMHYSYTGETSRQIFLCTTFPGTTAPIPAFRKPEQGEEKTPPLLMSWIIVCFLPDFSLSSTDALGKLKIGPSPLAPRSAFVANIC